MTTEEKITISQWNTLSEAGKEKLRIWAVQNGYELDVIPSATESFDPACDYAALLTKEQLITYLNQANKRVQKNDEKTCEELWEQLIQLVDPIEGERTSG